MLESAWRVLKKDGEFIFTVPSVQFGSYLAASRFLAALGLKKKAVSYGDEKNRRSGHLHVYETEKWKELLEDKKFKADKIEHIFPPEAVFLWSFMHSFLFRIFFLPFRLLRDFNIKPVDNLLRFILTKSLSSWISGKAGIKDKVK